MTHWASVSESADSEANCKSPHKKANEITHIFLNGMDVSESCTSASEAYH